MGISGACRREELCKMSINDIEFKGDVILVSVPETKNNVPRRFAITNPEWINLLLKYKELRPGATQRFFCTYRNGRCINSSVGINTIGKIPSQVAEYLKLEAPKDYSGHCFRRSAATLLANNGGDLLTLKKFGGWKSSSVAEGYVDDSVQNKINVAEKLMQPIAGPSSSVPKTVNLTQSTFSNFNPYPAESSANSIFNCTNCTINVYNNNASNTG